MEEFGVSVSAIQVAFGRMNVNKQLWIKAPKFSLPRSNFNRYSP
jgi:hypothetical protein